MPPSLKRPRAEAGAKRGGGGGGGGGRGSVRAPPSAGAPWRERGLDDVLEGGSDSDDLDEAVPDAPPAEATLEDLETADAKRLRLARAYLGKIAREVRSGAPRRGPLEDGELAGRDGDEEGEEEEGGEEEEEDDDAARGVLRARPAEQFGAAQRDAVTARLREDALLVSGSFFRPIAAGLDAIALANPGLVTFRKAHRVRVCTGTLHSAPCPTPHPHTHVPFSHPVPQLAVTCVAISPDGRTVVTGSKDCTALRWRLTPASAGKPAAVEVTGRCAGRARTKADVQRQLAEAAGGGGRGVAAVLGGTFGGGRLGPRGPQAPAAVGAGPTEPRIIRGAGGVSTIIAHVPDARRSAGAPGGGGALSHRNVVDYGILGHWDEVLSVALSTDGAFLVTGGRDKTVRVWDATAAAAPPPAQIGGDGGGGGGSGGASSSAAGGASAAAAVAHLPNVDSFIGHKDGVTALAFRPGTRVLYSGGLDRLVKVWSLDEMAHADTLFGHQAEITGLCVPPGGLLGKEVVAGGSGKERCITSGRDRTARLWKIPEQSQLVFHSASTAQSLECVAAVSEHVHLTGAADGSLSLWSTSRKKPVFTLPAAHGTGVHLPAVDARAPPAALAAIAAAAEATAGEGGLVPARAVASLAADADGGGPPSELLAAIAAATGCAEDALSGGYCAQVCALAVMPHADVFATGSGDGFVRLWQLVASGGGAAAEAAAFRAIKPLGAIPIKGIVNGLAFSRDGRTLVAAVATEHRLGRWWRYSGAQNGLAVLSLPLPRGK